MSLEKLPVELVSMIFEECHSREDISALRLVSKKFAAIGARYAVESLNLTFRAKSFQNLQSIAQHPTLSKLVEQVTYEADLLRKVDYKTWLKSIPPPHDLIIPPYSPDWAIEKEKIDFGSEDFKLRQMREMREDSYYGTLKAWMKKYDPELAYTKQELEVAFCAFEKEAAAVNNILDENLDFSVLASSFKSFPKLEQVELILGGCLEVFEYDFEESGSLRAAFKETLTMPHLLPLEGNLGSGSQVEWEPPQDAVDPSRGVRQLESVLLSIGCSGIKLKYLSFGTVDWSFFETNDETLRSNMSAPARNSRHATFAERPDLYLPAFVHLETICLAIQRREFLWEVDLDSEALDGRLPRIARLRQVLSAAPNLISLSLTLEDPRAAETRSLSVIFMGVIKWDSIARETHWPKLELFELKWAPFSQKFFLSFLKRHAKTLRSLVLDNIFLTSSTIPEFFRKLKNDIGRFAKLKEVDLSGYFMFSKEENGEKFLHRMDMESRQSDGRTRGEMIRDYLLEDGEYPFDKDYWKDDEPTKLYFSDGSPVVVPYDF